MMPVKFWYEENGEVRSRIITDWDRTYGGEEFRAEAETLDETIDDVLDEGVRLNQSLKSQNIDASPVFRSTWAFGRAVKDSDILTNPTVKTERVIILWRAMAAKARLGIRSTDPYNRVEAWKQLRDPRRPDVTSPKGGVRDMYETAIWLQQHEFEEAAAIFGGDLGNAREIGARTRINVFPLRRALGDWIKNLSDADRRLVHDRSNFQLIAKALRARWPARGPGSAQSPEHLAPDDLADEVTRILNPVLADILAHTHLSPAVPTDPTTTTPNPEDPTP